MFQFWKNIHFETQKEGKGTRKLIFFTYHQYIHTIRRRFARTCEWIYGIIHHIILVLIVIYLIKSYINYDILLIEYSLYFMCIRTNFTVYQSSIICLVEFCASFTDNFYFQFAVVNMITTINWLEILRINCMTAIKWTVVAWHHRREYKKKTINFTRFPTWQYSVGQMRMLYLLLNI